MSTARSLREWWATWNIQFIVIASLVLQVFLIFSAPLRKRMPKWYITMPIWLAYLLADGSATFAVGLIARSQDQSKRPPNGDLLVFWAPFLLVHLGGPDTITAFSLGDNEFWLRHTLTLVVQCLAVLYVFYLSFHESKLWIPSVLMFIAGLIKYSERTRALYLASSNRFRNSLLGKPDPGPNHPDLMDNNTSEVEDDLISGPNGMNIIENKADWDCLTDFQVIQHGHLLFETFKGLFADQIFSQRDRRVCRDYFLKRSSRDAFKILEVELNFIYEILYTKAWVVQGIYGYPLRIISFVLSCAALVFFKLMEKPEDRYKSFDVGLTYSLLGGAIALDAIAFVMVLCSDWTAVALSEPNGGYTDDSNSFKKLLSNVKKILGDCLGIDRERWPRGREEAPQNNSCFPSGSMMKTMRRRWYGLISLHNLIDRCMRPRFPKVQFVVDLFGLADMLDLIQYVEITDVLPDLKDLIFNDLKAKSGAAEELETTRKVFSSRGDWILRFENHTKLLPWIEKADYDESILLWHIATELLYNTDDVGASAVSDESLKRMDFKRFSKLLSDYMLYLLIMKSTMMSRVAGIGQIRYRDTCAETVRFSDKSDTGKAGELSCFSSFTSWFVSSDLESGEEKPMTSCFKSLRNFFTCGKDEQGSGETKQAKMPKVACERILSVHTTGPPLADKGDGSKSALFDASMLAKELIKLGEEDKDNNRKGKWEIICRVWLEIMCYAAYRCGANTHAEQLSQGGELITLVWLLISHFSLGNQYQIGEGHVTRQN